MLRVRRDKRFMLPWAVTLLLMSLSYAMSGCVDEGADKDQEGTEGSMPASQDDSDTTRPAKCGNDTIESGEHCDDGNTVSGDSCSAKCRLEADCSDLLNCCSDVICAAADCNASQASVCNRGTLEAIIQNGDGACAATLAILDNPACLPVPALPENDLEPPDSQLGTEADAGSSVRETTADGIEDVAEDSATSADAGTEVQAVTCSTAMTACSDSCVDLRSSKEHCGGCANRCAPNEYCADGSCLCGPGRKTCGEEGCRGIMNDPLNCGDCGAVCPVNAYCEQGSCLCRGDMIKCGGECVPLDRANCGECGTACAASEVCSSVSSLTECTEFCTSTADASPGSCENGICTDLDNDPVNCGECGNICPGDQLCLSGTCMCYREAAYGEASILCDGVCVDLQADPANCGSCGQVCPGDSECISGGCRCRTGPGVSDWAPLCDGNCVNLMADSQNCGTCGNACPRPGCIDGVCVCPAICNSRCADFTSDVEHCGACNSACAIGEVCAQGSCFLNPPPEAPLCFNNGSNTAVCSPRFTNLPYQYICGAGQVLPQDATCDFVGDNVWCCND